MKATRYNKMLARFNLLAENGIMETVESLFISEIERLEALNCTVEKKGKDPFSQRKWICKVTLPANWNIQK